MSSPVSVTGTTHPPVTASAQPQTPLAPSSHFGDSASFAQAIPRASPPAATSPGLNSLSRWTSGLASFGKSPPRAEAVNIPVGASPSDPPHTTGKMMHDPMEAHRDIPHTHDDEHHFEQHDSFEYGDFGDMRNKSWTSAQKGRRAVSMSMASGQTAASASMLGSSPPAGGGGPGSVMAMLTGFGAMRDEGALSPGGGGGAGGPGASVFGTSLSSSLGSPNGLGGFGPQNGVMADKAAKAQGVMRRLSLGGGFQRPGFLSPPQGSGALPPSPPALATPAPAMPAPAAAAPLSSAPEAHATAGDGAKAAARGMMNRGRRYSETGGKKRGVSPMGERILRDHGHF